LEAAEAKWGSFDASKISFLGPGEAREEAKVVVGAQSAFGFLWLRKELL